MSRLAVALDEAQSRMGHPELITIAKAMQDI
jgi:hypothetical protein